MPYKIILLILFSLLLTCTDPKGTTDALMQKGYTNITITGYKPFSCWKNDQATGFTAIDSTGDTVSGCACNNQKSTHSVS